MFDGKIFLEKDSYYRKEKFFNSSDVMQVKLKETSQISTIPFQTCARNNNYL